MGHGEIDEEDETELTLKPDFVNLIKSHPVQYCYFSPGIKS